MTPESPREIAQGLVDYASTRDLDNWVTPGIGALRMARALVEIDRLLRQLDELDSAANHEDFEVTVNTIASILDGIPAEEKEG